MRSHQNNNFEGSSVELELEELTSFERQEISSFVPHCDNNMKISYIKSYSGPDRITFKDNDLVNDGGR